MTVPSKKLAWVSAWATYTGWESKRVTIESAVTRSAASVKVKQCSPELAPWRYGAVRVTAVAE